MTAKATTSPPTKAKKTTPRVASDRKTAKQLDEVEFRRWTPEEVVEKQLLPYRTPRSLREKCYRREVFHHRDGGRITFTADDIRREIERGAVVPLAA